MTTVEKPSSNAQRALQALRGMVFDGTLPAGSDHLETELADRLGMSRTPVREAVLALEAQGLVEVRPRRGIRVLPISEDDMRAIYDILTELESLAAERAAERTLSDAALVPMRQALDDMDSALSAGDLDTWAEADDRYHAALVSLSGNARLVAMTGMMRDQVRRARLTTLHMRPPPHGSNRDHRAVFDAIQQGDAARARALHHTHSKEVREVLTTLIGRLRLRHL